MQELEKGKYATTDNYVAHALINPHGIYVLLVTNRRILYLKRDELFGTWAVRVFFSVYELTLYNLSHYH